MEAQVHRGEQELGEGEPPTRTRSHERLALERIGTLLGRWQARELRVARAFRECRGLSQEQLEDLYQETALALLARPYRDESHLRNALRVGLKQRALNLHRDERRRGEILAQNAPGLQLLAQTREAQDAPEAAALARADRLIVSEFLTELSPLERRVFSLLAEGMRYRAIAPLLGIATNEARKAARGCERKRERFQLLYDSGRLCGFRALTIEALQRGEATSEELAVRAFAHLEGCARCRTQHRTTARRLRRRFHEQAAALLPPMLLAKLGWLQRVGLRAKGLHERLPTSGPLPGPGSAREGAAGLLLGGAGAAKLAAGVATVAVIAGTAISSAPAPHPRRAADRAHHRTAARGAAGPHARATPPALAEVDAPPEPALQAQAVAAHASPAAPTPPAFGPGRVVPIARAAARAAAASAQRSSGFSGPGAATSASGSGEARVTSPGAGGPFSP